jgi:uncharacterized repeat protein (TIGR01451 family)
MASASYPAITLTVNVGSGAPASVTNTATVSGGGEINTSNNTANDLTTVNASADLSITKTGSPNPVVVGHNLTYTITVNNAGPSGAQNVVVTDTLPSGVTFVSTGGCAGDPNGVPTCNLGTITAGGSKQYTVTVTVKKSTTGTITNNVSVSSSTTDPTPGNSTASGETTVSDTPVPVPVPTMNELGMIIFILFAGLGPIYYLRRL